MCGAGSSALSIARQSAAIGCATMPKAGTRPPLLNVAAIFLIVALVYFAAYSSKRLVARAPEEEVALVGEAERELAHT